MYEIYFHLAIAGINSDVGTEVGFRMITSKTLKTKIYLKYENFRANLMKILRFVDHVCLTADIWSIKTKSFLGVTLHWIDNLTLDRKSATISCARFKSPHTGERIAECIEVLTDELEVTQKVIATVTDNGSNFVKCFNEFGITFDQILSTENRTDVVYEEQSSTENQDLVEDLEVEFSEIQTQNLSSQVRCASHTLNLVAMTDVAEAMQNKHYKKIQESTFEKLNFLWKMSNTQKGSQEIVEILGSSLTKPNNTRWNSFFDSLNDLRKKDFEKINRALRVLGSETFLNTEIEFINEYLTIMEKLARSLDHLQKTNCYFAILLPTIHSTKYHLENLSMKNSFVHCKPLLHAIIKGLDKRFDYMLDFFDEKSYPAILATCSHPFFKTRWIHERLKTDNSLKLIENLLVLEAVQLNNEDKSQTEKQVSLQETHTVNNNQQQYDYEGI